MDNLVLGLDIGTSSLKLIVLNVRTLQTEFELNRPTLESRLSNENKDFNEQSVHVILRLVHEMFREIPGEVLNRVKAVQTCGQVIG